MRALSVEALFIDGELPGGVELARFASTLDAPPEVVFLDPLRDDPDAREAAR